MAKLKDAIKNLGNAVNNKEPEGYYVTDMLKSFGTDLTGTQIEGKGITDVLNDIADNYTGGGGSATLIEKSITENGTYAATSDNADGYSTVTVDVPTSGGNYDSLTITENGYYDNPQQYGCDAWNVVEVNVSSGANLGSGSFDSEGSYSASDYGLDGWDTIDIAIMNPTYSVTYNLDQATATYDETEVPMNGLFATILEPDEPAADYDFEVTMGGTNITYNPLYVVELDGGDVKKAIVIPQVTGDIEITYTIQEEPEEEPEE